MRADSIVDAAPNTLLRPTCIASPVRQNMGIGVLWNGALLATRIPPSICAAAGGKPRHTQRLACQQPPLHRACGGPHAARHTYAWHERSTRPFAHRAHTVARARHCRRCVEPPLSRRAARPLISNCRKSLASTPKARPRASQRTASKELCVWRKRPQSCTRAQQQDTAPERAARGGERQK